MIPWRIKLSCHAGTNNYHGEGDVTLRKGFSIVKLEVARGFARRFIRYWADGSWWFVDLRIVRR